MCIWAGLQSIAGIGICLRTCARAAESCHLTGRGFAARHPGQQWSVQAFPIRTSLCVGQVHCRFLCDLEGSCRAAMACMDIVAVPVSDIEVAQEGPNRLRIGEEQYGYIYERMWGMNIWKCVRACTSNWVQPPAQPDTRLWLLKIDGAWMAAHAPSSSLSFEALAQVMQPVFGSTENILEAGSHAWDYFEGTNNQPAGNFVTVHLQ